MTVRLALRKASKWIIETDEWLFVVSVLSSGA